MSKPSGIRAGSRTTRRIAVARDPAHQPAQAEPRRGAIDPRQELRTPHDRRAHLLKRKRIAVDVKKALQSAIANAENNHQLDVDRLVRQAEAYRRQGAGRSSGSTLAPAAAPLPVQKPFSNLYRGRARAGRGDAGEQA